MSQGAKDTILSWILILAHSKEFVVALACCRVTTFAISWITSDTQFLFPFPIDWIRFDLISLFTSCSTAGSLCLAPVTLLDLPLCFLLGLVLQLVLFLSNLTRLLSKNYFGFQCFMLSYLTFFMKTVIPLAKFGEINNQSNMSFEESESRLRTNLSCIITIHLAQYIEEDYTWFPPCLIIV
jgi:hypothetical protein